MADHTSDFRLNADGPSHEDDAFARAIAEPLRAAERAATDFDARLMAAVRAEPPHREVAHTRSGGDHPSSRSWFTRERQLRASPMLIGAIAAGFAAIVSAATISAVRAAGGGAQAMIAAAPSAADTVHLVRFVLVAPDARTVSLVGDFNGWTADMTPLQPINGAGSWVATVPLPAGRHEYAFVVEDSGSSRRWSLDPLAPAVRDEHDTQTSVISVGTDVARRL